MTAFAENLRAARTMKGWSLQELADQIGSVSRQALHKYEQGLMEPEGEILSLLTKVLGVEPGYFFRSKRVSLGQVDFRKKVKLSAKEAASIKEHIRDYVERYLEVEELLRISHHFQAPFGWCSQTNSPKRWPVTTADDVEQAVVHIQEAWELGMNPITSIIDTLEDKGVCVFSVPTSSAFNGLATFPNGLPVVVLNEHDTPERRRFTALHELGHLVLSFEGLEPKLIETFCHRFASALLLPRKVTTWKFGATRTRISHYELKAVKEQYGISVQAIMRRLSDLEIITAGHYKYFCIRMAKNKLETGYGSYAGEAARPQRFRQLVHRLIAEDVVSVSKAAALVGTSLSAFRNEYLSIEECDTTNLPSKTPSYS
ncbi:ImmA/IrrE family metallo-endopeptidase [Hymenobacter sp. BT186]|uniref:ImmA/IrrE family metallo-endopeptidase n=1 Tax=Hymenobacter telluris TaxID=2816474 RepID=A0A939JEV7_9BACT|nr:XRE family transcriptional regulator [Hymenobacter telluris]MBO0360835.1 ImmA/IrrE family metallo-endopeptidase [Hymenobacter telluris]MBW3376864.1 XRE family transcriptional regulator [Hymenobacter norwichensis]